MTFFGNDIHTTSYQNLDDLCEHVELTNPEVDINSLRNKVLAYEESLSGDILRNNLCVYIAIISGEIFATIRYNALEEKLFDEERKLRIVLDDYVCTINCEKWSHQVVGEYSNITYEISQNDEENYPLIIVYKDRVHLLNKKGRVDGVVNCKYRLFNASSFMKK